VEIIKQLASKFQVQLAPELGDTLPNVLGLELQILVVIEPLSGHALTPYLIVADPVQIHSFLFYATHRTPSRLLSRRVPREFPPDFVEIAGSFSTSGMIE